MNTPGTTTNHFGAAYTLATPNPDGSTDFLPTTKPLTPFKAAQVLSPGEPSGVFKDAGGYWVLTTGDEYRTLKLQKCVSDFAKASGVDEYIQQAAANNLTNLKTAMAINAGFVDTSEIEQNPQWFPADGAIMPADSYVSLENELAGNAAGSTGIPTLSQVAQDLKSVVANNPLPATGPVSSQALTAPPVQGSQSPLPASAAGNTGPLSPLLQNEALTRMAQQLAADVFKGLAGQLGDDTIVKAKISVSQTLPADQAQAALAQLASGTPGGSHPMISVNPGNPAPAFTDKMVGLPPVRLESLMRPWPAEAPGNSPMSVANPFATSGPMVKPSPDAQF